MRLLLGPDGDVFQQQWLDLLGADVLFDVAGGGGELDQGRLRVDDDVDLAVLVLPAHIPRVDLMEGGLAVVQFDLSLALDEVLAFLILSDPLSAGLAGSHADIDEVG